MALIDLSFSIGAPKFYRHFKLLKTERKEIRRNKDLRSHLAIKLGTSRIEDHAALKNADCAKSFLLETLADLKRDLPLTLTKIL